MGDDTFKPPQHVIDTRNSISELIFSIVDQDIAAPYRKIKFGNFDDKIPLLMQIARNLRTLCADRKNTYTQINNSNSNKKGGRNGNDT